MAEEFDASVDTSDVDASADMDTSDVVDDVPDDIPDDIPEDVPEDEPEMTEEDDLSEDIPEDVPEDESELTEENNLSDDIPEDVPEDEPELTEEDELSEDIPEDVPEDESELTGENDLSDDIPEDVPEDEPEITGEDGLPDDVPEDIPEEQEEIEDAFSDVDGGDSAEPADDAQDDSMGDAATEEVVEDTSSEADSDDSTDPTDEDAQNEPLNDITTDGTSEDATPNVDNGDTAEPIEGTQDESMDDAATSEDAVNASSDVDGGDTAKPIEGTQDESMDDAATSEDAVNASSDVDGGDTAKPVEDTLDKSMDDTTTDEVAEDATSDLDSGDSTETAEDTQDEPMDDTAADETTEDATSDLDSGDSTETAEDTQDEPMDDTSNKNSADTVETADNINDTTDVNEVNNLSDKVSYLDRMRGDAENALAYDPERKGDWDVVRGRLSDEYRKTSDNLKTLAEGKQAEYEQLRNEYFDALEGADSPEKAARLAELTKRGGELSKEIDTANSRSRYADNFANELSRDLDPSKRTTYEGVGGKSFTDLHQSMIQKQGNAVKDFKGTCGDCSAANTMTALGDTKSEAEVVQRARDLNACVDKKIPSFLPESLKEKMRGSNGGTSVAGRSQILDSFGYDCDNRTNQSLAEISQQIANGKGAIINVDHRVLNKQKDVTAMNPIGTDHALTITGIEKDAAGNAIGLWIHDTGVCSNMGNAFYCNAQDYATWRNTPNCTVQYVSKK